MIFQKHTPSPHLQQHIAYYWTLQSDGKKEHGLHYRMIPDGYVDWMFHIKTPWHFSQSNNSEKKQFRSHLFAHSKNNIEVILPTDELFVFGVKFHPWAAHEIWNINMGETTNQEISLSDLSIFKNSFLEEQTINAPNIFNKIKIIESFLENKIQLNKKQSLQPFVNYILKNNDKTVNKNISQRRLQQRFKNEIGISPKLLKRTVRINWVIQQLINSPKINLTAFAYQFGFFDQSHFIKEFKNFTGLSPSAFLKSVNPNGEIFNLRVG